MRRQRRTINYMDDDEYTQSSMAYEMLPNGQTSEQFLGMERLTYRSLLEQQQPRFESTIEAKVEDGDTLQALALRFHCSVADIKRLNKIDKDNEIYARKVLKIPLTVHSVLLGNIPTVHKSGNNSPKQDTTETQVTMKNPLEDARIILDEKLLVAAVNSAGTNSNNNNHHHHLNNVIFNSNLTAANTAYTDEERKTTRALNDANAPLLDSYLDAADDDNVPQLLPIRGPALTALDCSGSDCDISWVCLFVIILALCFVIPLLYVIYLAEHPTHHKHHAPNFSVHSNH